MKKNKLKKLSVYSSEQSLNSTQRVRKWDSQQVNQAVAWGVAVLTLIVYGAALLNGFVNWDDDLYVYNNPFIRSLKPAFFSWAFTDLSAGFWHPFTWLSYALDYAIWGVNPVGYHLTAIFLHALNTGLVVILVTRLICNPLLPESASWLKPFPEGHGILITAGITGLLFGLHPLHVESVAWVSERKDLLCALFFLLSVTAYVDYVRLRGENSDARLSIPFWKEKKYLLSLGMFFCALASKTMAVSLPVVLLILDRYHFSRNRCRKDLIDTFVEKIPFIAASLLISVVSITAQQSIGTMPMMASSSLGMRLLVASRSLMAYLGKMIIPLDLIPFYPYPKHVSLLSPVYAASILLFMAISAASFRGTGKLRALLPAWAYYLVTLLPVLGIVQVGTYSMADRFTYLPSIGPFLLAGLATAWAWYRVGNTAFSRKVIVAVVIVLATAMSSLTLKQISFWRTSINLWNHLIDREPVSVPTAYLNRGVAFGDKKEFGSAITDFTTTLSIDPRNVDAYLNRGMAYVARGEYDKAIRDYDAAIVVKPDFADAYTNRGSVFLRKKDFDRAIAEYNRAISLQPGLSAAYLNRALVYKEKGELDRAIEDYSRSLQLNPYFANAYMSRGDLHMKKGSIESAVADYQKACNLGSEAGCNKALFPFSVK